MTAEMPVLVIRRKQLIAAALSLFIPAVGWTATDYINTRDVARAVKIKADGLEQDVRETRQNVLQALIMMHTQFTGNSAEIGKLQQELGKLKAEAAKEEKQ